jgi:hypothetical protein
LELPYLPLYKATLPFSTKENTSTIKKKEAAEGATKENISRFNFQSKARRILLLSPSIFKATKDEAADGATVEGAAA